MYSTIDLFAGAGGLSLGFAQTGKFDIKAAFENNPVMQNTYRRNHPHTEVFGDVSKADYTELQEKYGLIDVVIGGPPCQGFSNANRQKSRIISHNNALVKEYMRAVRELRPKAFVMENVSMLRSDVHRFYLSSDTEELAAKGIIKTKSTSLVLLDQKYLTDRLTKDLPAMLDDPRQVMDHLWPDEDFYTLNVIYKASKNETRLRKALNKWERQLCRYAEHHLADNRNDSIGEADQAAFCIIKKYYGGTANIHSVMEDITPAVMYQKMFRIADEISQNQIIVHYTVGADGIEALVSSFSVFDYFKTILGEEGLGYHITPDVLSAADYGAPQKRFRFVAVGIRGDIASEAQLPTPQFAKENYRTVQDAIRDLEEVPPVTDNAEDTGIILKEKFNLSDLASSLRDSGVLYNHLITKTSTVALQRFKAIKQGENFHSLPEELKTNTYTDTARTQNTIYQRLNYQEPSGTVVNVRKSMWIHPTLDRAVSVREAARLQTFPDSFVFTGTKDKKYQQVGNAVPPVLAKAVAESLAEQLDAAMAD